MRLKRLLITLALAVVSALSCRNDRIEPEGEQLRSVTVEEAVVGLQPGGSATVHFRVKSPLFTVSGLSAIVLTPPSASSRIALRSLAEDTVKGRYSLEIQDIGSGRFSSDVRIGVRVSPASDAVVMSETFTVTNSESVPGAPDTGLPVLRINTENGATVKNKTDWVAATLFIGSDEFACGIRGRGNSTWEWPKKPYALKLEKRSSLLGMPAHKRWVLLANFLDRTLMRNIVAMKVSSLTSLAWTPSCRSVELILNGRHAGTYLLIEQVRVDSERVDIDEDEGIMLELDFHDDNENRWIDYHGHCWQKPSGIPFSVKYPDADELSAERFGQIKQYVSQVASAVYGPDFADPALGYARYLDVQSFIDYWIVFEVMGNHELGNPGSVYMHKDRGGKLTAGPCWDFDWGVLSYKTSPQARYSLVNEHAIWYERLMSDPSFRSAVRERFLALLPQLEKIPDFMEETERELEESARVNFSMWDPSQDASMNGGSIINGDERLSFHEACVRLRDIYRERLQIIRKTL